MSWDYYKLTQTPPFLAGNNPSAQYSLPHYGGDDRLRGTKSWMNKYVSWEKVIPTGPLQTFKSIFTTLMKTATVALCLFGVGFYIRRLYRNGHKNLEQYRLNSLDRMKLVKACGGKDFCNRIPTINLVFPQHAHNPGLQEVPDYIPIPSDDLFKNAKSAVIQGIDATGRCYIALRVKNKVTGVFEKGILHQRYRETTLFNYGTRMNCPWTGLGVLEKDPLHTLQTVVDKLSKIVKGSHEQYELSISDLMID